MVRLLATVSLIASLVLFPPAALAFVSQDALPGDILYPAKRTLERAILAAASLTPVTRAYFSTAMVESRYKETTSLLSKGEAASGSLNELVVQTATAVQDISKIDDSVKRQELITKLSADIDSYNQGLAQTQQISPQIDLPQPSPTVSAESNPVPDGNGLDPTPAGAVSPLQTNSPPRPGLTQLKVSTVPLQPTRPSPSVTNSSASSPTPKPQASAKPEATSLPVPTMRPSIIPASVPSLSPIPTHAPAPSPPTSDDEIAEARERLQKIKDELAKLKTSSVNEHKNLKNNGVKTRSESEENQAQGKKDLPNADSSKNEPQDKDLKNRVKDKKEKD